MTLLSFLLILLCIAIETIEQCFYRRAGRKSSSFIPTVLPAIALNLLGLAIWLVVLKSVDLGRALPLLAANNLTVALAGKWLFGEKVDLRRWVGIVLIIAGFVLVAAKPL